MTSDIDSTARWTVRQTKDGEPARLVALSDTFEAAPEAVWSAIVEPKNLGVWFFRLQGKLHQGGNYRLRQNADGEILECDPARRLAVSWNYGGMTSWLTLSLTAEGGGTRLTLEHLMVVTDETWDYYGPGATGVGWDLAFRGLRIFLATGTGVNADQLSGWTRTDEGIAICTASSEGWVQAALSDGANPETARNAGAMTVAFYTG